MNREVPADDFDPSRRQPDDERPASRDVPPSDPSSRESGLDEVLADYLDALDRGENPDREEILAKHPGYASKLQQYFADADFVESVIPRAEVDPALARLPALPSPSEEATVRIGHHELLEKIDSGGMSVIYRAKDLKTERIVALKMILYGKDANAEQVARFRLEAQAVASLDHPNIVPLYEVGEYDGLHFFTMKFLDGGTLSDRIPELRGKPREAARVVRDVAYAIDHAHKAGILHRDLKPANILFDKAGVPYVSDFGLAKRLGDETSLTRSGFLVGTIKYMAPEQARNPKRAATVSVDVYALGALLYEALAGQPPFPGSSEVEILKSLILEAPSPPSRFAPGIPRDLETICLKCLEKDPEKRYRSALELAEDLDRFLEHKPIHARPVSPVGRILRWAKRRPSLAALVLVVCGAILASLAIALASNRALRIAAEREHRAADRAAAQALLMRRYVYAGWMRECTAALRRNDYAEVRARLEALKPPPGEEDFRSFDWYYFWKLAHLDRVTLEGHAAPVSAVAVSPCSTRVATGSHDGTVRLWDAASGRELALLCRFGGYISGLAFTPNGAKLAIGCTDGIARLWDPKAGAELRQFRGHTGPIEGIALSPRGDLLATASKDSTVRIWDLEGGVEIARISHGDKEVWNAAFSSDGRLLATAGPAAYAALFSMPEANRIGFLKSNTTGISCTAFSPRGLFFAAGDWHGFLGVMDAGENAKVFGGKWHEGAIRGVAFSPDGLRIASTGGDHLVRITGARSGENLTALRGHDREVLCVAWAPDGSFLVSGSSDWTAKVWDSVPPENPARLVGHRKRVASCAIAPDERRLVTAGDDGTFILWDLEDWATREGPRRLARIDAGLPGELCLDVSADGRRAGLASEKGAMRLVELCWDDDPPSARELHADASAETVAPSPPVEIRFSPDSSRAACSRRDGSVTFWELRRGSATQGDQLRWKRGDSFRAPERFVTDVLFSPNGRFLAFVTERSPLAHLRDVETGRTFGPLRGHEAWIVALAFSPGGELLATGGLDRTIRLWDLTRMEDARCVAVLHGHTNAVASLAFSPDGRILASGSDDRSVRLWDVVTHELRTELKAHETEVDALIFAPDARTLVTAGGGKGPGEVLAWRAARDAEVERRSRDAVPAQVAGGRQTKP